MGAIIFKFSEKRVIINIGFRNTAVNVYLTYITYFIQNQVFSCGNKTNLNLTIGLMFGFCLNFIFIKCEYLLRIYIFTYKNIPLFCVLLRINWSHSVIFLL